MLLVWVMGLIVQKSGDHLVEVSLISYIPNGVYTPGSSNIAAWNGWTRIEDVFFS